MRGFLYKEFVVNKSMLFMLGFTFLSIGVIFNIFITEAKAEDFFIAYAEYCFINVISYLVLSMMNEMSFKNDERASWQSFSTSTPLSRKGQLRAKYLHILVIDFGMLIIFFLSDAVTKWITKDAFSTLNIGFVFFCFSLIINAVEIPFLIRFGSAKGNSVRFGIIGIIIMAVIIYGLFGDLSFLFEGSNIFLVITDFFQAENFKKFMVMLFIAAVILFLLSYLISVKLYRKGSENYEQ